MRTVSRRELPITRPGVIAAIDKRRADLDRMLRAEVIQPSHISSQYAPPEQVAAYLKACHEAVVRVLARDAAAFSSAQWLWYLRRVPPHLMQSVEDAEMDSFTEANTADALTALYGSTRSDQRDKRGPAYRVDPRTMSHVLHLIGGIKYLRGLDWLMRSAARSTRMAFGLGRELPNEFPTEEQQQATDLYLARLKQTGGRFASRAGILLADPVARFVPPLSVVAAYRRRPYEATETWDFVGPTGVARTEVETVDAAFGLSLVSYRRLADFVARNATLPADWPSQVFGAAAVLLRMAVELENHGRYNQSVRMYGYYSVDSEFLPDMLRPHFGRAFDDVRATIPRTSLPSTPEQLVAILEAVRGSIRPLRAGAGVRVDGDLTLVDAAAATARLEYDLQLPDALTAIANERALYFERQIQGIIDHTQWKPPAHIRVLIGRHLEIAGKPFTDIDAIGCFGNTLLIVSAKSKLFNDALEAGEYAAVRNAASTVVSACEAARSVERVLTNTPIGSNFDFSAFSRIAVVVCLPYTVFVPLGPATTDVLAGLPAAVSVSELEDFLAARPR